MKILIITNDWYPKKGGISTYLINLVKNFNQEIFIFGPNWIEGDNTFRSSSKFIIPSRRIIKEIQQVLKDKEISHILLGSSNPQFLLVHPLLKFNIPISMVAHGAEFNIIRFIPILRQIMIKSMNSVNVIFTISNFSVRKLEKITSTRILLIGAGSPDLLSENKTKIKEVKHKIVGVSSRFVSRKKIDWVMEVCSLLSDEGYNLHLYVYGYGRLENKLKSLSELCSVKTFFYSDNENTNIEDFYKEIDIFAMPSHSRFFGLEYEGLGLVYLEAAIHGLPVITGSSGGSPETIIPGKTGFVANTKTHLYDAVKFFLDNPEAIESFGIANKKYVLSKFSWVDVSSKLQQGLEAN